VTAKKASGLRAALAKKQVLTTHYDIPLVERTVVDEIVERLQTARRARLIAPFGDGTDAEVRTAIRKADAAVKAAQVELDACFHRVTFRGLPGDDDLDALVNRYPPTEAQVAEAQAAIDKAKADGVAKDDLPSLPQIDPDPFNLAYLMACVQDSDLTEDEWREELWSERWTPQDRSNAQGTGIFDRVHQANQRGFNDGIPFE
jgi:hypothetical protein